MVGAEPKPMPVMPGYMNFVIGGTSGLLATCIMQPADSLKTRMQLVGPAGRNVPVLSMAKDIVARAEIFGLYRGLSAALIRQGTYTAGRLGVFNAILDMYNAKSGVPSFPKKVGMGAIAGGIGAFIGTPAEVALIRMTTDGRLPPELKRNYKNVFNAMGRITREEGILTLWKGASATVCRAMVMNGVQLGAYAQSREMLLPYLGDGLHLHVVTAIIAGFITTGASLPIDIIKTRVQNSKKGASHMAVLGSIIKNEGVSALWQGMVPTYLKVGPMTIFIFIFFEQLKSMYNKKAT